MASPDYPLILPQGVNGLVIRFSDRLGDAANRATIAFRADIEADMPAGVEETSTALASVFLRYDPEATDFAALADALRRRLGAGDYYEAPLPRNRRRWNIPAVFGGSRAPMLASAAKLAGKTPAEAIHDLTDHPVRVLAIGFAPGQPYLGELGPEWNIERLPDLIDVPEAAIVLAIRQLVLFANPSPTGWQHVGQTAFRCFRPELDDPFAFRPGDEVQFHTVPEAEFDKLAGADDGGATCEALE